MNNLYKSFKLIALCAAVIGLAACQKTSNEDLMALNGQIANNTLQGIYTYIAVDSAAMSTTLYEWELTKSDAGAKSGAYRVAATGNGLDQNTEDALTWDEATMSADGLSMNIPVIVKGESKNLLWHDGVVTVDGYTTGKDLISKVSVLRSVHDNFANLDFVYNDTASYITTHKDTTYYLAWKTEVVSWPQDSIDNYKAYLITMADTLKWFNETYPNQAVPDTVRFSTKKQADGTYKGQISRAYETMDVKDIETNHGPLTIINSEMVYNRVGTANTGSFTLHNQTWTEKCYTKPTDTAAVQIDELLNITNAKWTPVEYTNIKKFVILIKGKAHRVLTVTKGGEVVSTKDENLDDFYYTVPLSAFNKTDGEVTFQEHKYKTK